MSEQTATNSFQEGLSMDFNPLVLPPSTLTHCLNGTLVTYNGNENVLLNDMGNARVETATLPPGYVPVGTASLGGIIYIASYNPLTGKSLIGSFPSPERNISKEDLGNLNNVPTIDLDDFLSRGEFLFKSENENEGVTQLEIVNTMLRVELMDDKIYSGDKFKVFSEKLSNILPYVSGYDSENTKHDPNLYPKYLKFHLISTNDQGKNIYLDQDLVWTLINDEPIDEPIDEEDLNHFYIFPKNINTNSGNTSLEEYRDVVNANYDVYCEKVSGKLGLIAELETPNTFSVAYDALVINDKESNSNTKKVQLYFYLNWGNNNTGKHKNRVNPAGVFIEYKGVNETGETTINSHKYEINYLGGTFEQDGFITNPKNYKTPDTLDNLDYPGINIPENYYDDDFDNINFLESWPEVSLDTMPPIYGPYWDTDNKRKNDGTDNQYILKGPIISYTINNQEVSNVTITCNGKKENPDIKDGILNLSIVPYMPFGKIMNLLKEISINLSKLGTGDISLKLYRYYVDDNKVTIDWKLEAYLEPNKKIKRVTFNFIPFTNNLSKLNNCIDNTYYNKKKYLIETLGNDNLEYDTVKVRLDPDKTDGMLNLIGEASPDSFYNYPINQQSYNGKFTSLVYFNEKLKKDDIYLLQIVINYSNDPIVIYRILHTSNIFNEAYLGSSEDFSNLILGDCLETQLSLNISPEKPEFTESPEYNFEPTSLRIEEKNGTLDYKIKFLYTSDIKLNIPINNEDIGIQIDDESDINQHNSIKCKTKIEGLDEVNSESDNPKRNYSDSKSIDFFQDITLPYKIYYSNPETFDKYHLEEISYPENSEMNIKFGGNNNKMWMWVDSIDKGRLYEKGTEDGGRVELNFQLTLGNILLEELNRLKVDYILVWIGTNYSGGAASDNNFRFRRFGTYRRYGPISRDHGLLSFLATCIRDSESANLYISSHSKVDNAFQALEKGGAPIGTTTASALFKCLYKTDKYDTYYKLVKDQIAYQRFAADSSSSLFYLDPSFSVNSKFLLSNMQNSTLKIHESEFPVNDKDTTNSQDTTNNKGLPKNLLLNYDDKKIFSNTFQFEFNIKNKAEIIKLYYNDFKVYCEDLDGNITEIDPTTLDSIWYLHDGEEIVEETGEKIGRLRKSYRFINKNGYIVVSNKYNPHATMDPTEDSDRFSLRRSLYQLRLTEVGNKKNSFIINNAFFGNWNANSDTDYIYKDEYGESTPKFPSSKEHSLKYDYISEYDLKRLDETT